MTRELHKQRAARSSLPARHGFTLVELLVVMAIIAVLVAILLPAVQKVREAASRTSCINNMKQMCLAVLNYESGAKHLPTAGEGIDPKAPATKYYEKHSTFTYLLPFIEQDATYKAMDLTKFYNDPVNQFAAKTQISAYLCPSAGPTADPAGYGQTSYMVISYTDVDPTTGLRNATGLDAFGSFVRQASALRIYGASGQLYDKNGALVTLASKPQFKTNAMKIVDVKDGTSNSMIMGEDGPYRNHQTVFPYMASTANDPYVVGGGVDGAPGYVADGNGKRALNRWAEPEGSSNGVSGPPQADPASAQFVAGTTSYAGPWVNQNASPPGGSGTAPGQCTWAMNNCGPNDELFGPHTGGVVVGFCDGHVGFLKENVSAATIYRLIHPSDGVPPDTTDAF